LPLFARCGIAFAHAALNTKRLTERERERLRRIVLSRLVHFHRYPVRTMSAMERMVARYASPPMNVLALMRRLRVVVPNFAQYVGTNIIIDEPIGTTGAILVQAELVGFAWLFAVHNLPEERELFEGLCLQPLEWKDHEALSRELDEFGIASRVAPAIEAPNKVAFMRLVKGLDSPVEVWLAARCGKLPCWC
jgi:hypothetical protein